MATRDSRLAVAFNLPNSITWARLVLSIVVFALMAAGLWAWACGLFVLAVSTDWLDGYFARAYGLTTQLGRILDPFVDKVIVCGTFIYLAAVPDQAAGIAPWMAVVVVGRELLVTALRSHLESAGTDFSASWAGKLKMVLQSVALPLALFTLALTGADLLTGTAWTALVFFRDVLIWAAVLATILSGLLYVRAAIR